MMTRLAARLDFRLSVELEFKGLLVLLYLKLPFLLGVLSALATWRLDGGETRRLGDAGTRAIQLTSIDAECLPFEQGVFSV